MVIHIILQINTACKIKSTVSFYRSFLKTSQNMEKIIFIALLACVLVAAERIPARGFSYDAIRQAESLNLRTKDIITKHNDGESTLIGTRAHLETYQTNLQTKSRSNININYIFHTGLRNITSITKVPNYG